MNNGEKLIEINNLTKYFVKKSGLVKKKETIVRAVEDVSFYINKGETFGLVGESGCGKSTAGRTIIRLYDVTNGDIIFRGQNLSKLSQKEMKPYRKNIQMIFQDPYASLNARMTVADIIGEPLTVHNVCDGKEKQEYIYELLNKVGLGKDHASRYPHEFSGGQRQRV